MTFSKPVHTTLQIPADPWLVQSSVKQLTSLKYLYDLRGLARQHILRNPVSQYGEISM